MTWMAGRLARAQLAAALAACVALAAVILAADRADSTARLWLSVLVVTVPGILGGFWGRRSWRASWSPARSGSRGRRTSPGSAG
jgi:hypothetical protein